MGWITGPPASQKMLTPSHVKRLILKSRHISHMIPYGSVSKPCTPVVHIKIAGKWMFIPLKMALIGIDP